MDPVAVSFVVFACTLGGSLIGIWLANVLPAHHLQAASRDTVNVGIGLVATMSALVLGLMTASAKSSFDEVDEAVKETAADILAVDRLLARFGPETAGIRGNLKAVLASRIEAVWPERLAHDGLPEVTENLANAEGIADAILRLEARGASQRWLQSRALEVTDEVFRARWLVFAGHAASVPPVFPSVLLFWLTITFTSFGMFAPRNATVLAALVAAALSVSGAVFLVFELDEPFDGLLRVSPEPLRYALARLAL